MPEARRAIRHLRGMRRSRIAASGFRDDNRGHSGSLDCFARNDVNCSDSHTEMNWSSFAQSRIDNLAVLGDQRACDDLIVPFDDELALFLVDHRLDEGVEVSGIKA